MKWKCYFYFQRTECFFRKLRNHLAETNSWSSHPGNQTARFLWTSEEVQFVGERTTNDENRSFYRSHVSWKQPLELFSKKKLWPFHSHLSRKACAGTFWWRRSWSSTGAQAGNWEIMAAADLEAQTSCFDLLNGVIQSVLSGPDHKPLHWHFRHRGQATAAPQKGRSLLRLCSTEDCSSSAADLQVAAPRLGRDCIHEDSNQCIYSQRMQACRGQFKHAQQWCKKRNKSSSSTWWQFIDH